MSPQPEEPPDGAHYRSGGRAQQEKRSVAGSREQGVPEDGDNYYAGDEKRVRIRTRRLLRCARGGKGGRGRGGELEG